MSTPEQPISLDWDTAKVVEIDNPQGVTWVRFPGLALVDLMKDGYELDIVPVATSDLVRQGSELRVGNLFDALINLGADSPADVYPINFVKVDSIQA